MDTHEFMKVFRSKVAYGSIKPVQFFKGAFQAQLRLDGTKVVAW